MNISALGAILNIATTNPNEAKALIKLLSIDVLKSLGDGKYLIGEKNSSAKEAFIAQSDKPLTEGEKYWVELSRNKNGTTKIQSPLKQPLFFKNLQNSSVDYSLKDLQNILSSKNPQNQLKQDLMERLSSATSKDEFTATSTLLLSLQSQIFTIPLNLKGYFSILQFKKRYNSQTKKTSIDFYTSLEFLGPISGLIWLHEESVSVELSVVFDKTKQLLQDSMKNISYNIKISIVKTIEPLYSTNLENLLDISI